MKNGMKKLTAQSFTNASQWLDTHGRDLDRMRLEFAFGKGNADSVLDALAKFKNSDGGFGHALEPDVRLADSSVIATTVALQILREVHTDVSNILVHGAIEYLIKTLDHDVLAWKCVPDHVDDAPHAPWWNPEDRPTGFTANPDSEIVSHFHYYCDLVPSALLRDLTEAARSHLRENSATLRMHDVYCAEWLRNIQTLSEATRKEILGQTHPAVMRVVETDLSKWNTYCARPLDLVDSPDSPYFAALRDAVAMNLEYLVDTQKDDGTWLVYWSWGENIKDEDEIAWRTSQREWQGVMIINNLKRLNAFDRLQS